MIAAILRLVISIGVVLASVVTIFEIAFAGMGPAVILHVGEAGDGVAVERVERIDPALIVEVGRIGIVRGVGADLTTVLHAVERRTYILEEFGAGGDQMDRARGIAEGARHRIGNVIPITGLIWGYEDGGAGGV